MLVDSALRPCPSFSLWREEGRLTNRRWVREDWALVQCWEGWPCPLRFPGLLR